MSVFSKALIAGFVGGAALLGASIEAGAITFNYVAVTNNNSTSVATGQAQLSLQIVDKGVIPTGPNAGLAIVQFNFINSGPLASFIGQVYFDDNASLFGVSNPYYGESNIGIVAQGGVSYLSDSPTPPNLPSQGNATPAFSTDFGYDATSPGTAKDGVDPGETLGLLLYLASGVTFDDVKAALLLGASGLRTGIHVGGFDGGYSEALVNGKCIADCGDDNNNTVVPLPAGLPLLLSACAVVGFAGWRKRRNATA